MTSLPATFEPVAPSLRGVTLMAQDWQHLTFVHWAVDPDLVAHFMPPGTRPDVIDGVTYVGLIPFRMHGAGLGRGPAVPYFGTFAETNVRLYSVDDQGRHGVVFLSLETTRLLVAIGARAAFATPYMWARMRLTVGADRVDYTTGRRWPGPRGAGGSIVTHVGEAVPDPSDLEQFLTARFGLHTSWLGRPLWIPNHHEPWPLHRATVELDDDLVAAAGLPGLIDRTPDSVLYSPGIRTTFGLPQRVRPGRSRRS